MKIEVITLNSFAIEQGGGNPAGVVIHAENLNETTMKQIAQKIGFSETAFVSDSKKADYKVRFFTPTDEVDLCGHATIGTFFYMASEGMIKPGSYFQETLAGILKIEIQNDNSVLMEQTNPEFFQKIEEEDKDFLEICKSLGIDSDKIGIKNCVAGVAENQLVHHEIKGKNTMRKMQVVSTGLKDLIIPVEDISTLNSIKIDRKKVIEISKKYDITGYHVFTLETENEENTAQCRNFAPLFGIDEESATGTSSGALACYLYENNLKTRVKLNGTINMKFEQGMTMGLPSLINTSLDIKIKNSEPVITAVRVGGKAMDISKILIEI